MLRVPVAPVNSRAPALKARPHLMCKIRLNLSLILRATMLARKKIPRMFATIK